MKGQLDKQQEQARLLVAQSLAGKTSPPANDMDGEDVPNYDENDQDERITYWTRQQLEKRTKELNLAKEDGNFSVKPNFGGKRLSGVEEMSMSDSSFSEGVSQISQPHSTTSDSQVRGNVSGLKQMKRHDAQRVERNVKKVVEMQIKN